MNGMSYNHELGLRSADISILVVYSLLFLFEIFIIIYYLIPLRIKSAYILLFYFVMAICVVSVMVEVSCRLAYRDPGFMVGP